MSCSVGIMYEHCISFSKFTTETYLQSKYFHSLSICFLCDNYEHRNRLRSRNFFPSHFSVTFGVLFLWKKFHHMKLSKAPHIIPKYHFYRYFAPLSTDSIFCSGIIEHSNGSFDIIWIQSYFKNRNISFAMCRTMYINILFSFSFILLAFKVLKTHSMKI